MSVVKKEFQFGNQKVTLETGRIARQADGAVMVYMGDTVVLVSCVAKKEAKGIITIAIIESFQF